MAKNDFSYPCFEMIAGPEEGRTIPLPPGEQTVGRASTNSLCLNDNSVSRNHALILVQGDQVTLQDLRSRNGIYVNDTKLPEGGSVLLKHKDRIRIGIYLLRFATEPIADEPDTPKPNLTAPPQASTAASYVAQPEEKEESAPPEDRPFLTDKPALEDDLQKELEESHKETALTFSPFPKMPEASLTRNIKIFFLVICLLSAVAGLFYFFYDRHLTQQNQEEGEIEPVEEEKTDFPEVIPQDKPIVPIVPEKPMETSKPQHSPRLFNIFLDVTSAPMMARIFFEGKDLGQTPLKTSVQVEPGKEYTVIAEFDLKDIRDKYQQRLTFKADALKEVVPLFFDAEIGMMKIMDLPRGAAFSLEGYYAYDALKSSPVKLTQILYGKPIYLPYGAYQIELRERVQIDNSKTYVDEVRYHRDFEMNEKQRVIELNIRDRDLQFFQAQIQSVPTGAQVYLDNESIGTTPYKGDLPLGTHELKLTREGYFDHVVPLDMRVNTPYETLVELKTSKVGELINKAKALRLTGQYQKAIDQLVEGLKIGGSNREKGEIYYLLGDNFYLLRAFDKALSYFDQAKGVPEFYYRALLGLARSEYALKNREKSLSLIAELFLNIKKEPTLKNEVETLFRQISPIKSVFYISSEPSGATVLLNGKEVSQKTPLLLPDLALGNYRIEIQKPGYKTLQIKKNVKLNDFSPVIVTLEPEI